MAFLIRKFDRAKWDASLQLFSSSGNDKSAILADTFSKCLFTTKNQLSFWRSETADWDELDHHLACIFSAANGPGRSDVIIIDELLLNGVEVTDEVGDAPVSDEANKFHRNLSNINYHLMGIIAETMMKTIIDDEKKEDKSKRVKRFTEKSVEKLVKKAAAEGVVDIEKASLNDRWANRLSAS